MTAALAIALLIATNLAACLMAWWAYQGKRAAQRLYRECTEERGMWQRLARAAFADLDATRKQRREAGRKGGLATAARRASDRDFDEMCEREHRARMDDAAWLDYPAALDEARRT